MAATVSDAPGASSNRTASADVAVVGAGIIGLAVAHHLVKSGRSVTVLDRRGVALEASFGNAGALAFSDILPLASPGIMWKAPRWLLDPLGPLSVPPSYLPHIIPWLVRFWRASRLDRVKAGALAQHSLMVLAKAETEPMLAEAGLAPMLRSDGSLELYESQAELAASLPGWTARREAGIAFRHLSGGEIATYQPGLSPRFVAATFVPEWKTVSDPYGLACGLAEHLARRGVSFVQDEVTGLSANGRGIGLELASGGSLRAGKAVLAAGAWSRRLARALGDRVPLETERGYNTTLPATAFDLKRQLIFGGHGFVVTPLATGIRIGGAVELGGLRRAPDFRRSEAMLKKAQTFLPGLNTEGGRQWMGFRPSLPDSLPVIGPSAASPDIVYAFGHGHLGLTQAAATGRLVADLVLDRPPAIPIEPFRADRFH